MKFGVLLISKDLSVGLLVKIGEDLDSISRRHRRCVGTDVGRLSLLRSLPSSPWGRMCFLLKYWCFFLITDELI